jgi:hypothetical protein
MKLRIPQNSRRHVLVFDAARHVERWGFTGIASNEAVDKAIPR